MEKPPDIDLWAPVDRDVLPSGLVDAMVRRDWVEIRKELGQVMDGITTDGGYGRALLQLALELPAGIDPVLDSYRAAASVDHGDWDGLRECVLNGSVETLQLLGMRDVVLAGLDQTELRGSQHPHYSMLLAGYEYEFSQMSRHFRHWARAMLHFEATETVWARRDVPPGRHFRHRRLQDQMLLAYAEVHAGILPTAIALALEAAHLGDETEPLRLYAPDLQALVSFAMGGERVPDLRLLTDLRKPTGLSPLGAWQVLLWVMPLLAVVGGDTFASSARLAETIAARLGSPRGQLVSHAWRIVAELGDPIPAWHRELPGLRAQAEKAGVGLQTLPHLLTAVITRRHADFVIAERTARRSGTTWAQVAALAWMMALSPTPLRGKWLVRLLDLTGWRRLVLVPPEISAQAALGLTQLGLRSASIVELAMVADRPSAAVDIAVRHIDDSRASDPSRLAAVDVLARLGTSRAQHTLTRLAKRSDALGARARAIERRGPGELSEREVEVLRLAGDGLTNLAIAERLALSRHTVARHLANARSKLGAANRTEAVVRLDDLTDRRPAVARRHN